jgi:hypothetical protein
LQKTVEQLRFARPVEHQPESEVERACVLALRFETFGDLPAARERWSKIRDQHLKPLDVRAWGILAADRVQKLRSSAAGGVENEGLFRRDLLNRSLAQMNAVTIQSEPRAKHKAAAVCRDMIELYGRDSDPEIREFAEQAELKLRAIGF